MLWFPFKMNRFVIPSLFLGIFLFLYLTPPLLSQNSDTASAIEETSPVATDTSTPADTATPTDSPEQKPTAAENDTPTKGKAKFLWSPIASIGLNQYYQVTALSEGFTPMATSFQVGFSGCYQLKPIKDVLILGFGTALGISHKRTGNKSEYDALSYLYFPVYFRIAFTKIPIFIDLGGFLNVLLSATSATYLQDKFSPIDLGTYFGLGVKIPKVPGLGSLEIGIHYQLGLKNIYKDDSLAASYQRGLFLTLSR